MRKISFLDIILNNNIKLYVKGDQAYMQPLITIFPGSYFIMCTALCRYIYITGHILHVLHINKNILFCDV